MHCGADWSTKSVCMMHQSHSHGHGESNIMVTSNGMCVHVAGSTPKPSYVQYVMLWCLLAYPKHKIEPRTTQSYLINELRSCHKICHKVCHKGRFIIATYSKEPVFHGQSGDMERDKGI